jgi:hypothetical protein
LRSSYQVFVQPQHYEVDTNDKRKKIGNTQIQEIEQACEQPVGQRRRQKGNFKNLSMNENRNTISQTRGYSKNSSIKKV